VAARNGAVATVAASVPAVRKLNLGAGFDAEEGFVTFDLSPWATPDVRGDAARLPFAAAAFSGVRAMHVLEHIERRDLIALMNECWRVLAEGGRANIEVPVFPHQLAIADPTHVSFFTSETFDYFCLGQGHDDHMRLYGIRPWRLCSRKRVSDGQILQVEMEKAAPA